LPTPFVGIEKAGSKLTYFVPATLQPKNQGLLKNHMKANTRNFSGGRECAGGLGGVGGWKEGVAEEEAAEGA
jgi:hypothetical protein